MHVNILIFVLSENACVEGMICSSGEVLCQVRFFSPPLKFMEVGNAARSAKSAVQDEHGAWFGFAVCPGALSGRDGFPAACCWDSLLLFIIRLAQGKIAPLLGSQPILR